MKHLKSYKLFESIVDVIEKVSLTGNLEKNKEAIFLIRDFMESEFENNDVEINGANIRILEGRIRCFFISFDGDKNIIIYPHKCNSIIFTEEKVERLGDEEFINYKNKLNDLNGVQINRLNEILEEFGLEFKRVTNYGVPSSFIIDKGVMEDLISKCGSADANGINITKIVY